MLKTIIMLSAKKFSIDAILLHFFNNCHQKLLQICTKWSYNKICSITMEDRTNNYLILKNNTNPKQNKL